MEDLEDKKVERGRCRVEWVLQWEGSDELSTACSDKRVSFVVHEASSQHCVSSVAASSVASILLEKNYAVSVLIIYSPYDIVT